MQETNSDITAKIRAYLEQEAIFSSQLPSEYTDDDDLFRMGVIDSLGLITIITFLEESFGISVTNRDLSEMNFKSVHAMSALVQSKKA